MNYRQAIYVAILWGIMLLLLWEGTLYFKRIGWWEAMDATVLFLIVASTITIMASIFLLIFGLFVLYEWLGEEKK